MNNLNEEITAWNIKKNTITEFAIKDNIVNIAFGKIKFKITCPSQNETFYIVESLGKQYTWLDDVNLYCLESSPTISKILTKLQKNIDSKLNEDRDTVSSAAFDSPKENIENYNIELYKKKKDLESYIANSKSQLTTTDKTVASLFNKTVVAQMIIDEFISSYGEFSKNINIKLDTTGNNIYHWKIKFSKFSNNSLNKQLETLNSKFNYNYIEMDLHFHDVLYPNFPPMIKLIRPRLKDSLMHKISNCKMVQLDFWNPTLRDANFIIKKVYNLLNLHAEIFIDTEMNDPTKFPTGSYHKIEEILLQLASFVNVNTIEDIDTEKYENNNPAQKKTQAVVQPKKKTYLKAGTGYGHSQATNWNIDDYVKIQKEKDKQLQIILNKILIEIQDIKQNEEGVIYNTLRHSFLIPYIKSQLQGVTLLEMGKHHQIYSTIFNILANLANENGIFLFDDDKNSLFEYLGELNKFGELAVKYDKNGADELIGTVMNIYSMIKPIIEEYRKQKKETVTSVIAVATEVKQEDKKTVYKNLMKDFVFDEAKIAGLNYYYQGELDKNKGIKVTYQNRLIREFSVLQSSLPLDMDASVFVRTDEQHMCVMRCMITGPKDTVYDSGCYIFDVYIQPQFPSGPPSVVFRNHGNKRFNPNLYANGKVCLSILGTWRGEKSESWNPDTSTLYQIFLSIQSQILVDEPYFNEPGYESEYGTEKGKINSKNYNNSIRYYVMKHAMLDLIKNPDSYPQFKDVIINHFKTKKERIIEICQKWVNEALSISLATFEDYNTQKFTKDDYENTFKEIKEALEKL
jgi:baculoviral IAP repeat-containing protein 6